MQFGATLQRILQRIVYCNPEHGPPQLAKIDLADGYYRIPLSPSAALRLAVVIPTDVAGLPLIAVPLTLPMGWSHSPPYFCAFTESITDVANARLSTTQSPPQHPLYTTTQTPAASSHIAHEFHPTAIVLGSPTLPPLAYHDVYVDDFITVAQAPRQEPAMLHLLHTLDNVFDSCPSPPCRHTISRSKLTKGDAVFSTQKRILGWDVDTARMQLSLPAHRLHAIGALLTATMSLKRTSRRKWAQLLGILRSSAPALYGATHLFSILQHAAKDSSARRIRLTPLVRTVLQDWLSILNDLHNSPAPLHTLVPTPPTIVATTDASRYGMGGAWTSLTESHPAHYLWRATFLPWVSHDLLTADNPHGQVSINDLELTALLTGATMASLQSSLPHSTILLGTDNTTACA
jgi:hypothetical protein